MTVSYTGGLKRQLFRWTGSVYQAIWKQVLLYLATYYGLYCLYRFVLSQHGQIVYEHVIRQMREYLQLIKVPFLLGFYITNIIIRWWDQFNTINWPENLMILLNANLPTEKYLRTRRTVARWLNLTSVLVWRSRSSKVAKRFPTDGHLVKSHLMTPDEKLLYDAVHTKFDKWWLPAIWTISLLRQSCDSGIIHPGVYIKMIKEVQLLHRNFQRFLHYDWIRIPLVYTQVVTVATHAYFSLSLLGGQMLTKSKGEVLEDPHPIVPTFPFITILQLIFFLGWLQVGESLLDPFGEHAEDFELNWVLDRNMFTSHMMVDTVSTQLPSTTTYKLRTLNYTKAAKTDPGYYHKKKKLTLHENEHRLIWHNSGVR